MEPQVYLPKKPWPAPNGHFYFVVLQQLQSLFFTKGLGSGSGRRSVPQNQAQTFIGTLNA